MTKTRIGVSMNYRQCQSGTERAYIDSPYFDALTKLGAVPVPILPIEDRDILDITLDGLQGVLLTGGLDLDPHLWQQQQHAKTELVHPRRQRVDFLLYERAKKRELPILGICLGLQMINVAHGGSLYQHLPDRDSNISHGREHEHTEHKLLLDHESLLYRRLKREHVIVKSGHHQGIERVGNGLLAAGMSEDGVVEMVELPNYPFLLAVQWHPEKDIENPVNKEVFMSFLQACMQDS